MGTGSAGTVSCRAWVALPIEVPSNIWWVERRGARLCSRLKAVSVLLLQSAGFQTRTIQGGTGNISWMLGLDVCQYRASIKSSDSGLHTL
mmetsp:Transcript_163727/g.397920  ORF Transcript_163727/g.397920 Transcript_163727/m.397920 type:complete len:90 (-) Transcript_163727:385-654(-)